MPDDLEAAFAALRAQMVQEIKRHARAVQAELGSLTLSDRLLEVMGRVPRHRFVPEELMAFAYVDSPLPIGCGKTVSQPFIVALMTELLDLGPEDRVLEIGTGLGYHTAVMAELAATVYTVEIIQELAEQAEALLTELGVRNAVRRIGDGGRGWPDEAPFDKVLVAAAPELIPEGFIMQLKPGGRMVVPAGAPDDQKLYLVEKDLHGATRTRAVLPVRFSALVRSH